MSRPSLLRRAAAATLGATSHPTRTTVLTPALELSLARRIAAAVIGVRSYQAAGTSPEPSRRWEVRRPADEAPRLTTAKARTPQPEKGTAPGDRPPHQRGPRPDRSARATVIFDPASPVVIGTSGTPSHQREHRPRHTLALAAVAAVLAIAFTAFGYQLRPLLHQQTPSHSVGGDDPTPTPVVSGVVPEAYLGSWTATITNAGGENTRSLVIKQGRVGDDVLILVADGPTTGDSYHCVFTAPLSAAPSGGDRLELGPSTLTSGTPAAACSPGKASTLTLTSDKRLRRTSDNGDTITYTRSR
ncbi:hypothetical protein [Streptomyces sp. Tue6028]|uniref:hypothetical protein n=1 Tax=Streptomyces sp. Tue6028 TaxID=2036037 RepID=UPI003D7189FF